MQCMLMVRSWSNTNSASTRFASQTYSPGSLHGAQMNKELYLSAHAG